MKICFKNLETCSFYPLKEKEKKAFVIMPFSSDFNEIYEKGIKETLENPPLVWKCDRSDERWDTPDTVCTICKCIQEASLIIADCTTKRSNVFLELGLSFGLEKNIIFLILQRKL